MDLELEKLYFESTCAFHDSVVNVFYCVCAAWMVSCSFCYKMEIILNLCTNLLSMKAIFMHQLKSQTLHSEFIE